MASKGFPSRTIATRTKEGDDAIVLQVGSPNSVSLYLEMTVLPTKGYCIYSAITKVKGAVVSRDDFRDFVKTSAGFWLPTRISQEAYNFDKNQVPYLASKLELLAFELPKTNVSLPDNIFDLSGTKEWKALPLTTALLPQGSPLLQKHTFNNPVGYRRMILIVLNLLLIAGLAGFLFYRKYARQ